MASCTWTTPSCSADSLSDLPPGTPRSSEAHSNFDIETPQQRICPPISILGEAQLFHDWQLGELIGEGRYGAVWECRQKASGALLACKQVDREASPEGAVDLEVACLLSAQDHPNVLHLEGIYEGKKNIYLITELCNGGDLYDYIREKGHLDETEARMLFQQTAAAVGHCHSRGVVHRDIKPENLLLYQCPTTGQKTIRLADFGLATIVRSGERAFGWVGSKPYEAPEVVRQEEYDSSADVFSLGVLLYSMLSGNWPSFTRNKELVVEKSFGCRRWMEVSAEAKDLIVRMLSFTPGMRPTISQVLQHSWFYPPRQGSFSSEFGWDYCDSSSLSEEEMDIALVELLRAEISEITPQAVEGMELEELDLELHL